MGRRQPPPSPLFLALLLLLTNRLAAAQTPSPSPRPFPTFKDAGVFVISAAHHLSSLSTHAPITTYLRDHNTASATFPQLLQLINRVDSAVSRRVEITHNSRPHASPPDTPDDPAVPRSCHLVRDSWRNDVNVFHLARGLPMPDTQCVSVARPHSLYDHGGLEDGAFHAIRNHARQLNDAAPAMVSSWRRTDPVLEARLANWTNPREPTGVYAARPANFSFVVPDQRCTYDHVAFVRQTAAWFVVVSLTNAPPGVVQPRFQREYVHEFVNLVYPGPNGEPRGAPWSVLSRVPIAETAPGSNRTWVRNTTTVLQTDYGAATAATFARQSPKDNIAVMEALKLGAHDVQQGSDATTASNIAILAFPLVLSAVPVALIASVNRVGLLAYTLLTDILTAVPLAIKGFELLQIGKQRSRVVLVRISGGNLPGPGVEKDDHGKYIFKAAEAWAAECRPTASLRSTGIILLTVAVVCMVTGVFAELWAIDYVNRRKTKAQAIGAADDKPYEAPVGWLVVPRLQHRSGSGMGDTPPSSSRTGHSRQDP